MPRLVFFLMVVAEYGVKQRDVVLNEDQGFAPCGATISKTTVRAGGLPPGSSQ